MTNPLVPTAYDVVMTVLSFLVLAAVVVGIVVLARRSSTPAAKQVDETARVQRSGD